MVSKHDNKRQAVVIIHGMGEQRPMDTLRSFVEGIRQYLLKTDESEKNTVIRSKPDGISDIYETRRLSLSASRNRPITDFYEFYWAHNMRENKFGHITSWLFKLLFPKKRIPDRVKIVWNTIWIFFIAVMLIVILLLWILGYDKIKSILSAIIVLPSLFSIVALFIKNSFLNSVGDAGRYFTPSPANVGERSMIRQQGLAFLKKIHERVGKDKYDRIIIVGHSLGSVVAYDLLRILWTEYDDSYEHVPVVDQTAISEIEKYSNGKKEISSIDEFQELQNHCWLQQKNIGNKWRISDFITIGSPLCNADYLIVNNVSFDVLKEQREFPVCPPVADDREKSIHYNSDPYDIKDGKRTVKILHHAALFAVTRWTNIYFSSDYIGGPMQRLFGPGVRDIFVKRKSIWFFPGGHTSYWNRDSEASLATIVKALHLRNR